jgi:hypothetical protein
MCCSSRSTRSVSGLARFTVNVRVPVAVTDAVRLIVPGARLTDWGPGPWPRI